jgi:hypothetical protein
LKEIRCFVSAWPASVAASREEHKECTVPPAAAFAAHAVRFLRLAKRRQCSHQGYARLGLHDAITLKRLF